MRLRLPRVGLALACLATAALHLYAAFALYPPPQMRPDPMFTLNGLGYVGLLGAYLLPIPFLEGRRGLIRWILGGYTLLTIVLWVVMGERTLATLGGQIGISAKAAEALLLVFLWADRPRPRAGIQGA
jgi:hypothetical protein